MSENALSFGSGHPVTVLLVDDQPMVAEAVRRMLAPEGDIRFQAVNDPGQAVQAALDISPTVVLLDLVMPEIDGLTLVRYFRAHSKLRDLPLIVLSTKEEPETKAQAFALGANDYLVKLPDRVELVARLRYHSQAYIRLLERNQAYQALARQLEQAAQYVRSLLPAPLTSGPVLTDWLFEPSAQLGGDALGYHFIDPEHLAFYVLDVCDHGVGPALLSVSALNVLRSQTLPGVDFRSPRQVLKGLNAVFQMESQNDLYFTIFYGVYQPGTGELRFASAGHPPALLLADGPGGPVFLKRPNLFIGAETEVNYKEDVVTVAAPARLFVFSDGVYEIARPQGPMWTMEELKDFLAGLDQAQGREMEQVLAHVREISGRKILDDDFTMLKLTFQASAG
jgi:sigma-B regulation protein RsbU (phosphoserine phosphatase)